MNMDTIKVFEKIFSDKKLFKRFVTLGYDEFFEFMKERTNSFFSKKEFENFATETISCYLAQDRKMEKLSYYELCNIAAGVKGKSYLKKSIATAIASIIGIGVPGLPASEWNSFAPSVNAEFDFRSLFRKSKMDLEIKEPQELDDVLKCILDTYDKELEELEAKDVNALRNYLNHDSNLWWRNNLSCEKIDPDIERKKERVLTSYYNSIMHSNGLKINSFVDVETLLSNVKFRETVNNNFGNFHYFDPIAYTSQKSPFWARVFNSSNKQSPSDFIKIPGTTCMSAITVLEHIARSEPSIINSMTKNLETTLKFSSPFLIGAAVIYSATIFLKSLKNLGMIAPKVQTTSDVLYNRLVYNRLKLTNDPIAIRELMIEFLKSNVICQDAAIERMVEIVSGITDLWDSCDKSGKPCTSACTMTFMGGSGIGKTFAARMLSFALFHKDMQPWQFITPTSVASLSVPTQNKESEMLSPADLIFNAQSETVRQLRLNNRVIIVIDRVDKIHKFDPDDTILERLSDARNTGKLLVRNGNNYEYIDVSRTVFICITNEFRECWGLPPEELSDTQKAARVRIDRDNSVVNCFDVVEFKYFNVDDYMFILKPWLTDLHDEYIKNYDLDIDFSDDFLRTLSESAVAANKGVHTINDILVSLRGALVTYRTTHKYNNKNKKLSAKYFPDAKHFDIFEVTNDADSDINNITKPKVDNNITINADNTESNANNNVETKADEITKISDNNRIESNADNNNNFEFNDNNKPNNNIIIEPNVDSDKESKVESNAEVNNDDALDYDSSDSNKLEIDNDNKLNIKNNSDN